MKHPLRGLLAYLLATAAFLIMLIAAGVFDPKPVGQRQTVLPETSLTVSQPGQSIRWLREPLPAGDFSLRATAVWQTGTQDSGVGLAVDDFVVAVSPLGYVLVQQAGEPVLPWQPWPHVQPGGNPNELWLDIRGSEISVRINRELLMRRQHK